MAVFSLFNRMLLLTDLIPLHLLYCGQTVMIGCNHTSFEWTRAVRHIYGIIRHMQGLYTILRKETTHFLQKTENLQAYKYLNKKQKKKRFSLETLLAFSQILLNLFPNISPITFMPLFQTFLTPLYFFPKCNLKSVDATCALRI